MPFDPLPQADEHTFKLARRTTDAQRELVPLLVKARDDIEDQILKAARNKKFATVAKLRDGLYRDIGLLYQSLNGKLDVWTRRTIRGTAKEWRALGIEDVKAAGETPQGGSWTQFNKRHVDEYFSRFNVFNAENLAATQTKTAPQLVRMAENDIRQLRQAVIEVNREAALTGITARERGILLQQRFESLIGKGLDSWKFIDKSGRRWKGGSYFAMLNRTVVANVARDAYHDQLSEGGRDTVQIIGSDPGVNPGCTAWVGTIVSLTGKTAGIPTIDKPRADNVFHVNCVHTTVYVSPLANPELIAAQRAEGTPDVEWRKGEKRKGGTGRPVGKKVSTKKDKTTAVAAKDVAKQDKKSNEFVPAKTREEAEEFARMNLVKEPYKIEEYISASTGKVVRTEKKSNVVYRGLSVDSANEINRGIFEMKSQGVPVPERILAKSLRKESYDMATNGYTLTINSKYMKTPKEARKRYQELQENFKRAKESLPILKEAKAAGKLDRTGEALLARAEEMTKYKRTHVGDGSPYDVVRHEMGHIFEKRTGWSKPVYSKFRDWETWKKERNDMLSEMMSEEYLFGLSSYPSETRLYGHMPAEVFAESFLSYMNGEGSKTLGPKTIAFFDKAFKR